jgi:APA family basic amino acid/polyamine antiporter
VLGLSQSTAIVVGTIIGSGIFLVPQEMMRAVGHSSLVYLAWIAGGLLSLFGAMTYAELAARMPEAGGEYVYIRRAYGDLPAFLYMWTWFAVAKPASIATVTIGLARTLALFPSLAWLDHTAIAAPIPLAWSQLFAITMTWLMTGLNYIGIRRAANFQLVFTWLCQRAWPRGKLRNCLPRRGGRLCRLHGRAYRGPLGLRRLERPQYGCG